MASASDESGGIDRRQAGRFRLDRRSAGLLVVDLQERLLRAMEAEAGPRALKNALLLVRAARRLKLSMAATEQYPRGLGPTVPELREALEGVRPIEKIEFSCANVPGIVEGFRSSHVEHVVLVGVETHVCVLQTALDLLAEGFSVHIPADAVASRTRLNLETGLRLAEQAGAAVTSTETVLFQLLGRAGTEEFRELSALVKEP